MAGLGGGAVLGWLAVGLGAGGRGGPSFSRKFFHVGVFTLAAVVHLLWGGGGILGFGGGVSAVLTLAVSGRWGGRRLLEALARGGNGPPRRSIVFPWLATAAGGLVNLVLLGEWAVVGYAVCGWGDAAGEWVGKRWGRRIWRRPIPWLPWAPEKTMEGSLAVWMVGTLGAWWALVMLGESWASAVVPAVAAAGAGAVVEGVRSGSDDNFWVQVVPAVTAWQLGS